MYLSNILEVGIANIHQVPQGILIEQDTENQVPQGILTESIKVAQVDREYAYLSPREIEEFKAIDDYIEFTTSPYPLIAKSPTRSYCIDGYNLVQEAIKTNASEIRCHIVHVVDDSEIEIALLKAASRLVSDQGQPCFCELIKICLNLEDMLLQSTENPIRYSHGGTRKGSNYTQNNREDNIRILLAERFGKSKSTIGKYISYGKYLDKEIIETLIQSKESRDFFEKVASNKRQFIKNLKCGLNDAPDIVEAVSRKMEEWLEEYHESGKIKPLIFKPEVQTEKKKCIIDPLSQFKHHKEYEVNQIEDTYEIIYQEIQIILESLCAFLVEGSCDKNEFPKIVRGELTEIARCLMRHDELMKSAISVEIKEVE